MQTLFYKYVYALNSQFQQQYKMIDTQLSMLDHHIQNYLIANESDHSKVHTAGRQLTDFSKREGFLELAFHSLLRGTQNSPQKILLLTSLIKDKFKYDFDSISLNYVNSYYDNLLSLAMKIPNSRDPSFKQISLSFAYIYIKIASMQEITVDQYLSPLIPKRESPSPVDYLLFNFYFKILQYIASEIDNSRLVIDQSSREIAKKQIYKQQKHIILVFNQSAETLWNNPKINKLNLIECFISWIDLKYHQDILNFLPNHTFMPKIMELLSDPYNNDTAAQSLKAIIDKIHPGLNTPLIEYLGINLVQLVDEIERLFIDKDIHDAETYLSLILEFSQKAIDVFVSQLSSQTLNFLAKLVIFTKYTKQNFKDIAQFWDDFLDKIYRSSLESTPLKMKSQISNLIYGLYDAICSRCCYPFPIIDRLNSKQQSAVIDQNEVAQEIYNQRQMSSDLFVGISKVISEQKYISLACNKISKLDQYNGYFWGHLQSYVYSLIQPLKKLTFINTQLNHLVNTFHDLIDQSRFKCPVFIKRTFLKLFRSLMHNSQKNKILLQKLFYYNSNCFNIPLLAQQADKTFCKGCELNPDIMSCEIGSFIVLLHSYPHRENIVKGVFHIICFKDQTIQSQLFDALCFLRNAVVEQGPKGPKKKDCMTSLIAVCKLLKQSHQMQSHLFILKQFVRESLPFIKESLTSVKSTHEDENPQVQRGVKMVKYIMRCLQNQFWQFVPQIYTCVMQSFQHYPICSYVYLVEIAITVYSKNPNYQQYLLHVYINFCKLSFSHLNKSNIEKYSFLLDDFIGMNKRFFIYNASIVLKSKQLTPLIDQCLDYIDSETPRIAKAAYTFFETIFMAYWRHEFIEIYNKDANNDPIGFNPNDAELYYELKIELADKVHYVVAKILNRLSQIPPEMVRNCIFDSVIAEIKAFPEWNYEIWKELIPPLPNDILVSRQKEQFMNYLSQVGEDEFYLVDKAIESLQKILYLMNKRMALSSKRKNYDIN